jgi:2-keto-4-pentenoate hydratase/2-oxohepta-3-ene-1,7-dioic acid hydratase in catechol pathway
MKIIRYAYKNEISYGVKENNSIKQLKKAPFDEIVYSGNVLNYFDVKLLSPVMPSKIIAVGLNYTGHAKELNLDIPPRPLLFLKPPSSVIAQNACIVRPKQSKQVDFEAELAIVIKKQCHNVKSEAVNDVILGYTCLNDVTARDLQTTESQWTRAKGFDTFCPIGPWVETQYDYKNKRVQSRLNGKIMQDSNTDDLIYSVEKIVCYTSAIMTLMPGDIISTGTPFGIGAMKNGDVIEIEVEGIGVLKNNVIDE